MARMKRTAYRHELIPAEGVEDAAVTDSSLSSDEYQSVDREETYDEFEDVFERGPASSKPNPGHDDQSDGDMEDAGCETEQQYFGADDVPSSAKIAQYDGDVDEDVLDNDAVDKMFDYSKVNTDEDLQASDVDAGVEKNLKYKDDFEYTDDKVDGDFELEDSAYDTDIDDTSSKSSRSANRRMQKSTPSSTPTSTRTRTPRRNAKKAPRSNARRSSGNGACRPSKGHPIGFNAIRDARCLGYQTKNRAAKRELIRWSDETYAHTLLAMAWVLETKGVEIPWEEIAAIVHRGATGEAFKQAVSKLRTKRDKEGLPVPPTRPIKGKSRRQCEAELKKILEKSRAVRKARRDLGADDDEEDPEVAEGGNPSASPDGFVRSAAMSISPGPFPLPKDILTPVSNISRTSPWIYGETNNEDVARPSTPVNQMQESTDGLCAELDMSDMSTSTTQQYYHPAVKPMGPPPAYQQQTTPRDHSASRIFRDYSPMIPSHNRSDSWYVQAGFLPRPQFYPAPPTTPTNQGAAAYYPYPAIPATPMTPPSVPRATSPECPPAPRSRSNSFRYERSLHADDADLDIDAIIRGVPPETLTPNRRRRGSMSTSSMRRPPSLGQIPEVSSTGSPLQPPPHFSNRSASHRRPSMSSIAEATGSPGQHYATPGMPGHALHGSMSASQQFCGGGGMMGAPMAGMPYGYGSGGDMPMQFMPTPPPPGYPMGMGMGPYSYAQQPQQQGGPSPFGAGPARFQDDMPPPPPWRLQQQQQDTAGERHDMPRPPPWQLQQQPLQHQNAAVKRQRSALPSSSSNLFGQTLNPHSTTISPSPSERAAALAFGPASPAQRTNEPTFNFTLGGDYATPSAGSPDPFVFGSSVGTGLPSAPARAPFPSRAQLRGEVEMEHDGETMQFDPSQATNTDSFGPSTQDSFGSNVQGSHVTPPQPRPGAFGDGGDDEMDVE